ncbi:MAG TPA: phage major capsid protein [Caldimonas sp.]|nr:phage major capsid protein [Caldimonas sp.]
MEISIANHAEVRARLAHIASVASAASESLGARKASPADLVKDLSKKEVEGFSFARAIRACLEGDWQKAGLEREISNALCDLRKEPAAPRSFLVPSALPFQVRGAPRYSERAIYQVGTAGAGGNLVETELLADDFVAVLRNSTVVGQLGARFLPGLVGDVNIPRQDTATQTYWVGESVALTESEATFDQVQLKPHTVGALSKISRQMILQSTPAIEQLVRNDLVETSALAVDAAALYGTGTSSQPTGIANTPDVGAVVMGTNGGDYTFDALVSLYAAPLVANAPQANLAYAINGKVRGYLATLKSSTGQYLWNPSQGIAGASPNSLLGYRYGVSNQLPYNLTKGTSAGICSMSIFGNWQELLIGEWGVLEFMVNPYDSTGFANGDVVVRAMQTIDVGLRHPESFAVLSDGLTPGF